MIKKINLEENIQSTPLSRNIPTYDNDNYHYTTITNLIIIYIEIFCIY